jgi:hypothetical protein
VRIAWIQHLAAERLTTPGLTVTAVIRAALDAYTRQLEELLDNAEGDMGDVVEQLRFATAVRGQVLGITRADACVSPPQKLSDVVKDFRRGQGRFVDRLSCPRRAPREAPLEVTP